ncbi:MAG: hypothetical protein ACI9IZ_001940, partial [Nonlabens sp.]
CQKKIIGIFKHRKTAYLIRVRIKFSPLEKGKTLKLLSIIYLTTSIH